MKGKIKITPKGVDKKINKNVKEKKGKKIKLSEALKNVFDGKKKIRRESWPIGCFVSMKDDVLCIFLENRKYHPWVITTPDITATDWQII